MMKKVLLLLLAASALVLWHMNSDAALDPALLRKAQAEFRARKASVHNPNFLTIIDYRKSLLQTRLYVYDQKLKKVVLASRCAHALNSGLLYARSFSNVNGSEQSCIGTFLTKTPYVGRFGYSLRINGLDSSNSNTLARAIIFHNAPYYIPYTLGCFATNVNTELIDKIQGGSLVYVSK